MPKYKLVVAYDGTQYGGWQVQANSLSIQTLIQRALETLLRVPTDLTGSGRTDAGVHALAQVAHFSAPQELDLRRTLHSLNALLPRDIRIQSIEAVEESFHARYSAVGKIYHYHLRLDPVASPFEHLYTTHVLHKVDLDLLRQACALFVGTHDFSSFANDADRGSASKNPVRTIRRIDVISQPGGVRMEFEGNGFLYKMVRNIVGTLLDVTNQKLSLEEIPRIFEAKDRRRAGQAAPPQGLFLVEVLY